VLPFSGRKRSDYSEKSSAWVFLEISMFTIIPSMLSCKVSTALPESLLKRYI